jgi:hypothetical protein
MKKLLILLMFLGYLPYLFLFTSVENVKDSERAYHCHVKTLGEVKEYLGYGMVYYNPLGLQAASNHAIILPYFFLHGEVKYAECAGKEIILGINDLKVEEKIRVVTIDRIVKIFGHTFHSETNWESFGTSSEKHFKEGEIILTKLVNDKEVQFFGGKKVKK